MKERILKEIKHLASENGGGTPSKAYFQEKTGIAESDWDGKLWLRWNDVVADGGLVPNEKQPRLSTDLVSDMYAEVCRHYGKPRFQRVGFIFSGPETISRLAAATSWKSELDREASHSLRKLNCSTPSKQMTLKVSKAIGVAVSQISAPT